MSDVLITVKALLFLSIPLTHSVAVLEEDSVRPAAGASSVLFHHQVEWMAPVEVARLHRRQNQRGERVNVRVAVVLAQVQTVVTSMRVHIYRSAHPGSRRLVKVPHGVGAPLCALEQRGAVLAQPVDEVRRQQRGQLQQLVGEDHAADLDGVEAEMRPGSQDFSASIAALVLT